MSVSLPPDVARTVKDRVYAEADSFCYLERGRVENGRFMDALVSNPDVGGVLERYIRKTEIRKYIKDGILNRYSKDKVDSLRPDNLTEMVEGMFGFPVAEIDMESKSKIVLYKCTAKDESNKYVVVSEGTVAKWETALRKALLYMPGKPFAENASNLIQIMLLLSANSRPVPPSDKVHLGKALSRFGVRVCYFGEP